MRSIVWHISFFFRYGLRIQNVTRANGPELMPILTLSVSLRRSVFPEVSTVRYAPSIGFVTYLLFYIPYKAAWSGTQ